MRANLRSGLVVVLAGCVTALCACGSKTSAPAPAEPATTQAAAGTSASEAAPPAPPAPAITAASWSPQLLDTLVAPIALYPDALVGQILAASVNTQEVLDAGNWLLQNPNLKGDALDSAAQQAGLGPPMRALVHFPTIVDMMCQEIDWTRQLGTAFASDQASVLAAVQRMRAQAMHVGNLKSTPQQTVETKTEGSKTIIEVKPADPQIIYVPQYNPQVVYTTPPAPPPPAPPPSTSGTVSTETAVISSLLAFGVGIAIGNSMNNNNYCYPNWGVGAVYVGPRPYYPAAYVYRPVYGPGYHPSYGYRPPSDYRYRYNQVNGDVNINVNRNNYFNQFNGNQDLRNRPTTLPANSAANGRGAEGWKGQSTYAGARDRPGQSATSGTAGGRAAAARDSGSLPRGPAGPAGNAGRPGNAAPGRTPPANAGAALNDRGARPGAAAGANSPIARNAGSPSRTPPPATTARPANAGAGRPATADRGYGTAGAAGAGAGGRAPNGAPGAPGAPQRDRALSGAGRGDGNFERAASTRGHASAGSAQANRGAAAGNRGGGQAARGGQPNRAGNNKR